MASRPRHRLITATIDTNIFISAVIVKHGNPYALIVAWLAGTFRQVTSLDQLAELERVLNRDKIKRRYGVTEEKVGEILAFARRAAGIVTPLSPLPVEVRDPNDNHIVGAALAGKADFLVSGDNDLLTLRDDPSLGTLRIVMVREFLDHLRAEQAE